jgi:hypothetical protein
MGVMAIGTGDLAFGNRVVRKFAGLRSLFFMAGIADLGLSPFVAYLVMCRVGFVA